MLAGRVAGIRVSRVAAVSEPALRVVVLTTSYPRTSDDPSGRFVADAVEHARALGHDVKVVSPAGFRAFGLAYGHGIVGNLRARPWLILLVPFFLLAFRRAAMRAAVDADLVHAHWLPSGAVAATLRRPYVVQVWGTDVALAQRMPWLWRPVVRRARLAIAPSRALAEEVGTLGAAEVRIVPPGVDIPKEVADPDEPPHVLYVGRLSGEKGIRQLAEAASEMPLVVVGDGPLRAALPQAIGFVPPQDLGGWYARASVIVAPSLREGYGMVAREAMAHARPVVASAVGGLLDAVEDEVTGLLVPPGDVEALRHALLRLLADGELRRRLGARARDVAMARFGHRAASDLLVEAWRAALARRDR
jgi:glycosyltransferase involved in cell wall biosynthesis